MRHNNLQMLPVRQLPLNWDEDEIWARLPAACQQQCEHEVARLLVQAATLIVLLDQGSDSHERQD